MTWQEQLEALRTRVVSEISSLTTWEAFSALENEVLGRKGALADLMKALKEVSDEERRTLGAKANEVKAELENLLRETRIRLNEVLLEARLKTESEDITETGIRPPRGNIHLVTHAIREITDIFERAGFARQRYPEIDWDWYAFESLNMPKDHPARDEWETFFMEAPTSAKGSMVLTPHTSNAQVREMEKKQFPIRMINIAKCYRRQSDATHVPMFHQFEGLYIDKNVSITHLRGLIEHFVHEFFGPDRKSRLRPFHFRFTEPSFEVDISCAVCGGTALAANGQKCRVCKQGWHELGGAGMVHPNVLKAGGVDETIYSGFAFGIGVERTYMMKEGLKVDDLRILYKNDIRFLQQF
jgi:phenylalanyl-tRNA synthetase alpha chain